MTRKTVLTILLLSLPYCLLSQIVAVTITWDSITIPAGSCYIDHDGSSGYDGPEEDPSIIIACPGGGGAVLYSKSWSEDLLIAGTYPLITDGQSCATSPNFFVIEPVNTALASTVSLFVETFERENASCNNTNNQDCAASATLAIDITVGVHSITVGQITYHYTVTHAPSISTDLTCGVGLPVELLNFDATVNLNYYVDIEWRTASERNNDYFAIERSADGFGWTEIEQKQGAGNSTTLLYYSSLDELPLLGVSYYRLKQVDFDGKFSYSDIQSVEVDFSQENGITLFPNPASNTVELYGSEEEISQLTIYDMMGKNLTEKVAVTNGRIDLVLDLRELSSGVYILKTKTQTKFLIKE